MVVDVAILGKNHAVSASADQTLIVWNTTSGIALRTLRGHGGWVRTVTALSTHLIASSSYDKTIRIWDAFSGTQLKSISYNGDMPRFVLLNKYTLVCSDFSRPSLLLDVSRPATSRAIFSAISEKTERNIKIPFISIVADYLFGEMIKPDVVAQAQ